MENRTARTARKRTSSPSSARSSKQAGKAARESSGQLISRIIEVSQKPGIRRDAIFKQGSSKRIYAYSVLPSDPSIMVRESAEGERAVGRLANGRFRVLKSKTL